MIITLYIYLLIILYIIGRGFYVSSKPSCNITNNISLQDSVLLISMPFYFNQGKINLFAFFLNFLIISLITFTLIPDPFPCYCMEEDINMDYFSDSDGMEENITNFLDSITNVLDTSSLKSRDCLFLNYYLGSPFSNYNNPDNGENLDLLLQQLSLERVNTENKIDPLLDSLKPTSVFNEIGSYLSAGNYLYAFESLHHDIQNILTIQNLATLKIQLIYSYHINIVEEQIDEIPFQEGVDDISSYLRPFLLGDTTVYFEGNSIESHSFFNDIKNLIIRNLEILHNYPTNFIITPEASVQASLNFEVNENFNIIQFQNFPRDYFGSAEANNPVQVGLQINTLYNNINEPIPASILAELSRDGILLNL